MNFCRDFKITDLTDKSFLLYCFVGMITIGLRYILFFTDIGSKTWSFKTKGSRVQM